MVQNSPFCRIGGNIWPFHGQRNTIGGNKYQNDEIKPGFFRQIATERPNFKGQEISEEFFHIFNSSEKTTEMICSIYALASKKG